MLQIKQGNGAGFKINLLYPSGKTVILKGCRYLTITLQLPDGAVQSCRRVGIDEVTNAVYLQLDKTELSTTGKYAVVITVQADDKTVVATPLFEILEVTSSAAPGYKEAVLSLSVKTVQNPAGIVTTGASPQIDTATGCWLVYNDTIKSYINSGVPVTSVSSAIDIPGRNIKDRSIDTSKTLFAHSGGVDAEDGGSFTELFTYGPDGEGISLGVEYSGVYFQMDNSKLFLARDDMRNVKLGSIVPAHTRFFSVTGDQEAELIMSSVNNNCQVFARFETDDGDTTVFGFAKNDLSNVDANALPLHISISYNKTKDIFTISQNKIIVETDNIDIRLLRLVKRNKCNSEFHTRNAVKCWKHPVGLSGGNGGNPTGPVNQKINSVFKYEKSNSFTLKHAYSGSIVESISSFVKPFYCFNEVERFAALRNTGRTKKIAANGIDQAGKITINRTQAKQHFGLAVFANNVQISNIAEFEIGICYKFDVDRENFLEKNIEKFISIK